MTSAETRGTLASAGDLLALQVGENATIGIQLTGTWVGTVSFEVSIDGVNWNALNVRATNGATDLSSTMANGQWSGGLGASSWVRLRMSAFTSGSAIASLRAIPLGGSSAGGGSSGGAATIADGADVAEGSTTDAAKTTDTSGTVVGFLRGLVARLLAQVLDYDTGAGTANQIIFGVALPASGGPVAGGTSTNPLRTDPTGTTTQPVTVGAALPAGTNAIGKLSANSGVDIGDVDVTSIVMPTGASAATVQGTVAHDGVDAQNPIKVGYKALAHGTNPTAVAANDRSDAYCNRAGIPWVIGGHPNIQTVEYRWTTAQTNDAVVSVTAGTRVVVTAAVVAIDSATTVAVAVRVGFGTTDALPTLPTDGNTAVGVFISHQGIVPGSGVARGDGSGILAIGADGEDLLITAGAATSGDGRLCVSYYTIEG